MKKQKPQNNKKYQYSGLIKTKTFVSYICYYDYFNVFETYKKLAKCLVCMKNVSFVNQSC